MISELSTVPTENLALLIPILGVIVGLFVAVTAIVSAQWRSAKQTELEISLKSQMIDRGMSPDEIERVLKATSYDDK